MTSTLTEQEQDALTQSEMEAQVASIFGKLWEADRAEADLLLDRAYELKGRLSKEAQNEIDERVERGLIPDGEFY